MKRGTNGNDRSGASKAHRKLRSVSKEAERLGVSKGWLYTEIREGRFPHVKLGSRVLLDPEEVDQFVDRCRITVEEALHQAEEDIRL